MMIVTTVAAIALGIAAVLNLMAPIWPAAKDSYAEHLFAYAVAGSLGTIFGVVLLVTFWGTAMVIVQSMEGAL